MVPGSQSYHWHHQLVADLAESAMSDWSKLSEEVTEAIPITKHHNYDGITILDNNMTPRPMARLNNDGQKTNRK